VSEGNRDPKRFRLLIWLSVWNGFF
jgi:hypothetical protein